MLDFSFLSTPMGMVLAVASCVAGSVAVMAIRAHLSSKRKTWSDLSQKFSQLQWPHVAEIFQCLAVNDISGAIRAGEALKKIMLDDTQRKQVLLGAAKSLATDLYQDPAYRPGFNDFVAQLQSSNLPDRASVFGSAVDEIAHQQTLLQDMKTRLQTGLTKAKTDIEAFNSKVATDVSNLSTTVAAAAPAVAVAVPPAAPVAAAVGAVAAATKTVIVPADHTVTVTPPPAAPAPEPASATSGS